MDKQRKTKELEMDDVKLFNTTTTTWTIGRNRNNYGKLTTKWKNENRLDQVGKENKNNKCKIVLDPYRYLVLYSYMRNKGKTIK
jgi:hypothetical protein